MNYPRDPRAVIEISRPGFTDGQGSVRWDSKETEGLFKSVDVELVTNESSQVEWTFFDPKFKVIDAFAAAGLNAQTVIRVWLGFGRDLGEPVFKGLLAEVKRGQTDTTFTSFDMAYKMKLEKKAGYKNKTDDLAIIRELVTRNGLQFEGPETPLKLEKDDTAMQDEKTDWDWMMERAQNAGLVIYVRHDTVFAKYPAKVGTPIRTLRNGKDFEIHPDFEFVFRTPENQDGKPKVVEHRRRGKAGKRVDGQSDVTGGQRKEIVLKKDQSKASKSKLTKRAQAQKELEREHAFEGHTQILMPYDGTTRYDYRSTVAIENMGKMFSGSYVCDAVNYTFGPGQLNVALDLYRDVVE